jgi:tRNA-specific 2-thiouridylase
MNKRVLLGMSGGVDSSVTAMLLQEAGYEVTGITFLFSGTDKACEKVSRQAASLCEKLTIKHISVDVREEFEQTVVNYFIQEYQHGRTPFPCAWCNPKLKFRYLEKYTQKENCDLISTGHYVRTGIYKGKKFLFEGKDPDKDQTFFLWGLERSTIDKLILPLGEYYKKEIREIAKKRGFIALSKKKDSLGLCFIEDKNYRIFFEKRGIKSEPGNFVDTKGKVLGKHNGILNYTIGQRRGLGLHQNFPLFVKEIRLDDNQIVLAKYTDLYKNTLRVKDCQFADKQEDITSKTLKVKVRYRLQETLCNLHILNDDVLRVDLLKPEAMISPGQTAVFYDKDRLVGGGFIESAE